VKAIAKKKKEPKTITGTVVGNRVIFYDKNGTPKMSIKKSRIPDGATVTMEGSMKK
jgi:hypothetical protein